MTVLLLVGDDDGLGLRVHGSRLQPGVMVEVSDWAGVWPLRLCTAV